jgi:hypothetical protein
MDIGGAAGMVDAAGTEEPVSVGVGVGEGGLAGAFLAESVAAGGSDSGSMGGAGRSIGMKLAQVPAVLVASRATRQSKA